MPAGAFRVHPDVHASRAGPLFAQAAVQCIALADTEQTEGEMKKSRVAAALSAVTFALVLPSVAYSHGQANNGAASDASAPTYTAQSSSSTNAAGNDAASSGDLAKSKADVGKKHPPTAAMDQATPPAKSAPGKSSAAKHPPTAAMDSAAPQERSPGSTSGQDSSSQSSTSGTRQ